MGVPGLSMFMNRNDYFRIHQLKDTILIIDGFNLVYQLFFHYQQQLNDHMYGGDYDELAKRVKQFFRNLQKCNIKPIVIFDGSIDPSLEKLQTMLSRCDKVLNNAHKIYANNYFIEGILPFLADCIFRLQLEQLNIPIYQTCYEADRTIIQIAYDLNCPILSNDSDFLLYNLPGGIVNLHSLFDYDLFVHRDPNDKNSSYLKCRYYCVKNLHRTYPKINFDLVQIIGFILGNDYIDKETISILTRRISSNKDRQKLISDVLNWISKHDSLESSIDHMGTILKNRQHNLIQFIQKYYISLKKTIPIDQETIDHKSYLEKYKTKLFLGQLDNMNTIPEWMREKFICKQIHCRLLSISLARIDWCRPLVEDFSYHQSSYETANELMQHIYGILRNDDRQLAKIKRYSRKDKEFKAQSIAPKIQYDNTKILPKLSEIKLMDEQKRKKLFLNILCIKSETYDLITKILNEKLKTLCPINDSMFISFSSMLIGLLFMLRNFHDHLWIEFVYSIYVNFWFTGHISCDTNAPTILKLEPKNHQNLLNNLVRFSSLPILSSSSVYMPRVVHFYNTFQICIHYIDFLSSILNLKNIYNIDMLLSALKGAFIYNLTVELCSRKKPFLYIQQLIGREKFKPLDIFIEIINIIFNESGRHLLVKNAINIDSDIVTDCLMDKITKIIRPNDRYFIRGSDFTNKRTHIQSQKLKLRR